MVLAFGYGTRPVSVDDSEGCGEIQAAFFRCKLAQLRRDIRGIFFTRLAPHCLKNIGEIHTQSGKEADDGLRFEGYPGVGGVLVVEQIVEVRKCERGSGSLVHGTSEGDGVRW